MMYQYIGAWAENKFRLREEIRTSGAHNDWDYKDLVELLFETVINPYIVKHTPISGKEFDLEEIVEIDHGSYQGTKIFLLHLDVYQPETFQYVYTSVDYGSCSGCDTLQGIQSQSDLINYGPFPTQSQIDDYMTLCLHLYQHTKFLSDDVEDVLSNG
ncbi:MAG: hypothetical protein J6T17_09995 [Clostridia bacterium]|nr:hypothetical protein [Clostridia bacterium]